MPTKAKNGKSQIVAARIPLELEAELKAEAEARKVPYSQIIVEALRVWLAENTAREEVEG